MENDFIDYIADKLNSRINIPLLNEAQEKELIHAILTIFFEFLPKYLKLQK